MKSMEVTTTTTTTTTPPRPPQRVKLSSSSSSSNNNNWAKNASLAALVLQQVGLVLFIRHSQTRSNDAATPTPPPPYLTSTAVFTAECVKLLLNVVLEQCMGGQCHRPILSPTAGPLAVPAGAYVVQNNLLFVALANLSVPVYQVTNQGKLLTTALCSRVLLGRHISWVQYAALSVLALGVALVQLSSMNKAVPTNMHGQQPWLGLAAVTVSCGTSGFAGVYFEKTLKSTQDISVYVRNSQLALWSMALGLVPLWWDQAAMRERGFFQGYDGVVWMVIVCQALTGLVVALVMKYADTILKGFATSVAVVVATLLSMAFWQSRVDYWFVVGAVMVMWAVHLYTVDTCTGMWCWREAVTKRRVRLVILPALLLLAWGLRMFFYDSMASSSQAMLRTT